MPLQLVTPFDREDQAPPLIAQATLARWRARSADVCFIVLKAGAFLGAIYLAVLGLPLLLFLALVGGDIELLFTQLGNLSAHFLAADQARQAAFAGGIKLGLFGIATLIAIWRLPRFLNEISATLDPREQEL